MKKIFTLAAFALVLASSVQAQTYNLFPSWAVDENGWLWFNSQEKIQAYVGTINNGTYVAETSGKIVQLADANYGDFAESIVSDTITGVGGTGSAAAIGAEGALKGAIVLSPASKIAGSNGGGMLLKLPSLATLSVKVSSIDNKYVVVRATKTGTNSIDQYEMVFNKYNVAVFSKLAGAGIYEWNGVQTLTNAASNTIVSDNEIYVLIQNSTNKPLYIHGIKVMTPKQETVGINEVTASSAASTDVYTVDGVLVKRGASDVEVKALTKGLYILRSGNDVKKVVVE